MELVFIFLHAIASLTVGWSNGHLHFHIFIGPRCLWGPIYGLTSLSLTHLCADLTDVTLADEDTNSILADNAKRAIQGNEALQVMKNNASGAVLWPNLQLMQVVPSGGHICN